MAKRRRNLKVGDLDLKGFDKQRQGFIQALHDILSNHNPTRLEEHVELAMRAPSHYPDDLYLEWPAALSLIEYGAPGVAALYRLATAERASGTHPAEIALIATSMGRADVLLPFIANAKVYLGDEQYNAMEERMTQAISDPTVQEEAKRRLEALIRHFVVDPVGMISLGTLLTSSTLLFSGTDSGGAAGAILGSIAKSSLKISEDVCDRLEQLVAEHLPEQAYQEFFQEHPALLDPMASSIVDRQYLADMFQTDFVIRRLDDEYVLVEIEKPSDRPLTRYPQPSAALSHALGQVVAWLSWIEDNVAYAQTHGYPRIHSPRGLIIIGERAQLNVPQSRMLAALNDLVHPRIKIMTYDDVIAAARNVLQNLTAS